VVARIQEPRSIGYLYIAPALVIYGLFVLFPFIHTIYYSFFSWDGIGPKHYVGFQNYSAIVSNPTLLGAFIHAFILIFFYSALTTCLGLVLASIMAKSTFRGLTFFRAVLFLPYIVAPTAVAVIWRWLLAPDGPINAVLTDIGLARFAQPWLGSFNLALPTVGLVGTWVLYGLTLVLLLSAIQKIPSELYEAARIDGASAVREFFAVTLPGLRNELSVVLVLTITAALRNFDIIYVMTQGGPGTSTQVPSYDVYYTAFVLGAVGAAAAVGVVLAFLLFIVNFFVARIGSVEA